MSGFNSLGSKDMGKFAKAQAKRWGYHTTVLPHSSGFEHQGHCWM